MEQQDDDMSEYFSFLGDNWRSIVSASGTDNMSGSEAQDLVYRIFSARKQQNTTKKFKSGGKLVGSFSLKNPFLDGIKTFNNDGKAGDDAVGQVEAETSGSENIKNLVNEVADSKPGSRKPRVQFRVPTKSNDGDSFNSVRFPATTGMMNSNRDLGIEIPPSEILPIKTTSHNETKNLLEGTNQQETTSHQETINQQEATNQKETTNQQETKNQQETTNPQETTYHQETTGHSEPGSEVEEVVSKRTKLFNCTRCKKGYDQSKSFKNHVCFKNVIKIPCPSCSKMVSKTNMSHHMKLHSLVKFDCKQCKKSFRSESMLAKHTQEHKAKKKHVCNICGQTCERPSHLKLHKLTHETKNSSDTGVKCKFCDWHSDSMLKLKTHLVDKHIEHAKKCAYCCKIYFSRRGMLGHLKTHEAENVNEDASYGMNEDVVEVGETMESVSGENETIDTVKGESATIDSVSGESGNRGDENAIVYNFSIENIGIMEEVIADGVYSIGDVSLTSADILPFIANM